MKDDAREAVEFFEAQDPVLLEQMLGQLRERHAREVAAASLTQSTIALATRARKRQRRGEVAPAG